MPEVMSHGGNVRMVKGKMFLRIQNMRQEVHFTMNSNTHRDLGGKKGKVTTFPIVEVGEDTVWFSRMTMIRTAINNCIRNTENGVRNYED